MGSNYILVRLCVVYVVKEARHFRGFSQLIGVERNRTRAQSVLQQQEERKKESCYVETGTNSNLFYLKYIHKVL